MKTFRLTKNPRKKKTHKKTRKKKRTARKIIRTRRNPPKRSGGYLVEALVRTGPKRFKNYWYSGSGFTRARGEAIVYSNEFSARAMAKKLLHQVSEKVYALRVVHADVKGSYRRSDDD